MQKTLSKKDELNSILFDDLFNFREVAIAVKTDIEQMFIQVQVKREGTQCLSFSYTHIFGARSSPTSVIYALTKSLEIDNIKEMANHLYMDDFIYSENDKTKTENLKQQGVSSRRSLEVKMQSYLKKPKKRKRRF